MRKITILFSSLIIPIVSLAQVVSPVKTLAWSDTLRSLEFSDYKLHEALYFNGAAYDDGAYGYLPFYFESVSVPVDGIPSVQLADEVYAPATVKKGMLPADLFKKVETAPIIKAAMGYEMKKPFVQLSIIPFRKNPATGIVERLISFRYTISV
ncbi:MAG TPA: hypothetical protein PLD84_15305, partial [Chitinophagales bacterium]|nr:hypothetical protein [Chitinophagales bacterium]